MIQGLQIVIGGEELGRRIGARIREHESRIGALEVRLKEREGDCSFDVRPEDDFKTIGQLRNERDHYAGRVLTLSLLRDNLDAGEFYSLSKADLRLAELIPADPDNDDESSTGTLVECHRAQPSAAIDGCSVALKAHRPSRR